VLFDDLVLKFCNNTNNAFESSKFISGHYNYSLSLHHNKSKSKLYIFLYSINRL